MIVFKYILLIFIFIYIIIINNYLNEKFVITYGKYMPRYYIKNYYDFQKRRFKEINENGEIVKDHLCIGEGADKVNANINKITLLSIYKIGNKQYIKKPQFEKVGNGVYKAKENKILTIATSGSDNDIFEKVIYIVTLGDGNFTLERSFMKDEILDNIYNNNFNVVDDDEKKTNTSYDYTKTISQFGNDENNRLLYYLFTNYNFNKIKEYFVCNCRPSLKPLCDRKEDDPSCREVSEIIISFVLNFNLNNLL
jgi:hypothetical protein